MMTSIDVEKVFPSSGRPDRIKTNDKDWGMAMIIFCSIFTTEDANYEDMDEFIRKIAKGDKEAFRALYQRSSNGVFALALSILRNRPDAEDVMQDTFLKVRGAAHLYHSQGKGNSWIMTICRNLCYMKIRREKFASFQSSEDFEDQLTTTIGDVEDQIVLKTAMEKLSAQDCEIVMMHVVAGLKHREIGDIMGLTLSTVLSKYNRALKKLKTELEGNL